MQRMSMNPEGLGLSSEQVKKMEEEEALTAKWNIISSVTAFGTIVLLLRVGQSSLLLILVICSVTY